MFRSHGTDAAREIWRFGDEGNIFYDTIAKFIRLRYQLLPYIYSLAAQVTANGRALLRAVALDFPDDTTTHNLTDEFLFGPALLVCPVTAPMYYGKNSQPIAGVKKSRQVYLPTGAKWFDFWTEKTYAGGKTIEADAPLEKIPLFVRAGSILPMTQPMQFADEIPGAPCEIRIYRGADGAFALYEDAGDGYGYERGEFALVNLSWSEARGEFLISARQGKFPGLIREREYQLVLISPTGRQNKNFRYTGSEARIRFEPEPQ
jgi:alpha-D-xyloside xylohydrolase